MASSKPDKPAMATLLFLLLLLLVHVDDAAAAASQPVVQAAKAMDCPATCLGRCGNSWKKEMCNKMCNVCCSRCNCVPPGTGQDTRHLCPCYDTMVNPKTGKLKCP